MANKVYFPITANILTPGHIKCLHWLKQKGHVIVGVLTSKALRGYKKEIVPFKDRIYILRTIAQAIGDITVVPQDSLNPTTNLKKYRCTTIASGDGWEIDELKAINRLHVKPLDIRFRGEKTKTYSSSRILNS